MAFSGDQDDLVLHVEIFTMTSAATLLSFKNACFKTLQVQVFLLNDIIFKDGCSSRGLITVSCYSAVHWFGLPSPGLSTLRQNYYTVIK